MNEWLTMFFFIFSGFSLGKILGEKDARKEFEKTLDGRLHGIENIEKENQKLRKALNKIANLDMTLSDRPTPYHIAVCALQRLWCAACGTWGNHTSGGCPAIEHKEKQ